MHEVLVNRLGGLGLPRKSVVRLTDRPDVTLDVYRGRKTTIQQYNNKPCMNKEFLVLLLHRKTAFNMIVLGPLKLFCHVPLIGDGAINWCCTVPMFL